MLVWICETTTRKSFWQKVFFCGSRVGTVNSDCLPMHPWLAVTFTDVVSWVKEADADGSFLQSAAHWYLSGQS